MKSKAIHVTAVLLALLLAASIPFLVSAKEYNDIYNSDVASAVSVLDALGIVEGFPDGGYYPDQTLTRAEFCKLAVLMMGLEDRTTSAAQRTLFSDVTSAHWASAYVNLAYNNGLIQGYGDGRFGPDDSVTYVQSLTILLRILGYTENDIGEYYPDDYIRYADKLGLTENVWNHADAAVTRGEAAVLFVNLLKSNTRSGDCYYKKVASQSIKDVVLLETDDTSDTGKKNCVKVYDNGKAVWYPKVIKLDNSLIGARGIAMINSDGYLLAFIPDGVSYRMMDGILLENNRRSTDVYSDLPYEVVLYDGRNALSYPRSASISANLVGDSGTLLLNEDGYAVAFLSHNTDSYTLTKDAVLLDENTVSDKNVNDCAAFYVNDKIVYYKLAWSNGISNYFVGKSGTILTDADGVLAAFIPDGNSPSYSDKYGITYGILVGSTASKASFYIGDDVVEYRLDGTVSTGDIGSFGMILLNSSGRVAAFVRDKSYPSYSLTQSGILLEANTLAADGRTMTAKLYMNGSIVTYKTNGNLDDNDEGFCGRLMLNEDNCAVAFIAENTNRNLDTMVTMAENTLVCANTAYEMEKRIPVILQGKLTAWESVYTMQDLTGRSVMIYFDSVGSLNLLIIK